MASSTGIRGFTLLGFRLPEDCLAVFLAMSGLLAFSEVVVTRQLRHIADLCWLPATGREAGPGPNAPGRRR